MERLFTDMLGRYDSLFVAPHADDVMLACPARVCSEVERGRHVLVLGLFGKSGADARAAEAVSTLGADYVAGGLASLRGSPGPALRAPLARAPEEDAATLDAVRLLADSGPRMQVVHVYAPLGLGASVDHRIAYEATVRAFASEPGRNLFLYEERPEAFVPGAVRVRLAMLGARLPPEARHSVTRVSLLRHMWAMNDPRRLRGEAVGFRDGLAALALARRRFREARPWNPQKALGPRLQPVVHVADEEAATRARAVAEMLLPRDRRQRRSAAQRFNVRAVAAARRLGGIYHAERFWLFLPSGYGLPEAQDPLDLPRS